MQQPRQRLRTGFVLLLMLSIGIGIGIGMLLSRQTSPPAPHIAAPPAAAKLPVPAANQAKRASLSATVETSHAPIQRRDVAPLPPLTAAFNRIAAELKQRADAGEPQAACRLMLEYARCDQQRVQLSVIERRLKFYENPPQFGANFPAARRDEVLASRSKDVAALGAQSEAMLTQMEQCSNIPQLTPLQRSAYWQIAARAGHLPSLRQYAVGNAFLWRDVLQSLPALDTYRREAEPMALRAAAAGDLATTLALAMAYRSDRGDQGRRNLLSQSVTPDNAAALALLQRTADALRDDARAPVKARRDAILRDIAAQRATMSEAEIDDASRQMDLYATHWAPLDTRAADKSAVNGEGNVRNIERSECTDNRFIETAP